MKMTGGQKQINTLDDLHDGQVIANILQSAGLATPEELKCPAHDKKGRINKINEVLQKDNIGFVLTPENIKDQDTIAFILDDIQEKIKPGKSID